MEVDGSADWRWVTGAGSGRGRSVRGTIEVKGSWMDGRAVGTESVARRVEMSDAGVNVVIVGLVDCLMSEG